MFQDMKSYMAHSKDERTSHLDLSSSCIEIGTKSRECRALLAHHLNTVVPTGLRIHLCHACHNGKCSNVKHLYWGTASENLKDQYIGSNRKNPHEIIKEKLGEEGYREFRREVARLGGKAKRKTVSEITESRKAFLQEFRNFVSTVDTTKRGWTKQVMSRFNISHTHVKRLMDSANKHLL